MVGRPASTVRAAPHQCKCKLNGYGLGVGTWSSTGDSPGVEAPATGQVSRHWRLGVGVRMPVYVVPRAPSVTAVLERVRAEREDSARLSTLARELLGHRDPPATAATPSASKHECRTHARTSCATAASSGSERQPADDEEACRERRSTPVLREASKHSRSAGGVEALLAELVDLQCERRKTVAASSLAFGDNAAKSAGFVTTCAWMETVSPAYHNM